MDVGIQRQAADRYLQRGVAVIPVPHRRKDPILKGWQDLRLTQEDVAIYWTDSQNIGALTGEPSGWRVNVDLDCHEADVAAERFLPETLTSGRAAKERSHWW
jgi:Bifunctional DNA primase/polymerase, N-terminal